MYHSSSLPPPFQGAHVYFFITKRGRRLVNILFDLSHVLEFGDLFSPSPALAPLFFFFNKSTYLAPRLTFWSCFGWGGFFFLLSPLFFFSQAKAWALPPWVSGEGLGLIGLSVSSLLLLLFFSYFFPSRSCRGLVWEIEFISHLFFFPSHPPSTWVNFLPDNNASSLVSSNIPMMRTSSFFPSTTTFSLCFHPPFVPPKKMDDAAGGPYHMESFVLALLLLSILCPTCSYVERDDRRFLDSYHRTF